MSERDDDFLSRWSRRKVDARDGGLQKKPVEPVHKPGRMRTDPPAPKEVDEATEAVAEPELVREAALQPEQTPASAEDANVEETDPESEEVADPEKFKDFDFDSLNYGSDYTQFMKKGVPEAIRKRALRKLWGSNPILANIDGLNDYDEDFTDAALAVKVLTSNYKPGLGYLTEEERNASYSEEARKAGPQPDDEGEASDDQGVEDADAEDMDESDEPDDVRTAEGDDVKKSGKDES